MATTDFEMRQLLKAYRKGPISDELFAEQRQELNGSNSHSQYVYNGKSHTSERDMIMPCLDEFRIAQIAADQQSKELLRSLIDDEWSSCKWLQEACATMSAA